MSEPMHFLYPLRQGIEKTEIRPALLCGRSTGCKVFRQRAGRTVIALPYIASKQDEAQAGAPRLPARVLPERRFERSEQPAVRSMVFPHFQEGADPLDRPLVIA
jgi:hypothetical protein